MRVNASVEKRIFDVADRLFDLRAHGFTGLEKCPRNDMSVHSWRAVNGQPSDERKECRISGKGWSLRINLNHVVIEARKWLALEAKVSGEIDAILHPTKEPAGEVT